MGKNKQIRRWKLHLVVWKLESAVARMAHLYGKWLELRLGQVGKDPDSPIEEMGTVTALGSKGRAQKRDCGSSSVETLVRDTRGSRSGRCHRAMEGVGWPPVSTVCAAMRLGDQVTEAGGGERKMKTD